MAELDRFEARFAAAYRRYLDETPVEVDAGAVARRVAVAAPRRQAWAAGFRPFGLSPALAWLLLLAGLLLALTVGSLVTGGWRPYVAILIGPSPSPAATATADEGTEVLATTKAGPLPAQATCPAGDDPNAPGPPAQERPPAPTNISTDRAMAFDRRAGRIVLLETKDRVMGAMAPAHTWTFDVCTNTWERKNPPSEPPTGRAWLAYDADSDRTVALVEAGAATERRFETWIYDLGADRWSRGSDTPLMPVPEDPRSPDWYLAYGLLYHDPSGLLVFHDGGHMWAYDLESDTWTAVRRQPDPTLPADAGLPAGVYLVGYDADRDRFVAFASRRLEGGGGVAETWTFDPGTGTWRFEAGADTPSIACGWGFAPECGAVFDARTGLTVFFSKVGYAADGYDAGLGTWRDLSGPNLANSDKCDNDTPVYDSVSGRIVCRAGQSGVAAFDISDGSNMRPWWLLEPLPAASPAP